ncbi:MAG: DUF4347 domain-containing protein [Marichromatium sp.]|nr:DUF4347 domain-containing protein [Marichromatium sp.]
MTDSQQIAVIDTQVPDYQSLQFAAEEAGLEVILLSGNGDGIEELAEALEGRSGIEALHILSHGASGQVYLGDDVLSSDSLDEHLDALGIISSAISEDGDLLLYGCEVGADGAGRAFLGDLSILTGADVAASDDATGADALGGDWDLEVTRGTIDATPWAATGVEGFDGVLAFTGTVTFNSASTNGFYNSEYSSVNGTYTFSGYTLVFDGESSSTAVYAAEYATVGGADYSETKLTLYFQGGCNV